MSTIFAIRYVYDPERSDDLARLRPEHRTFLRTLYDDGELLASGPLGENEALIIMEADSADAALGLLNPDPLHRAGIVASRSAHRWQPVIGPWA
ncbi:MAG: YciI family protein [Actinomycetaceae bacterium]|nr:YciI family protein [Arcanobacterium sp.]MDD7686485.1 YciI family protein [Actinomycetaceae bacterium]MDY5272765.1 YciI family protein [Arcanobacterium sp.]